MKKRVKLLEAQADWRTKGDIETGQTNQLPHSTVHVADMPMLQQMDGIHVDNNARLIFGDSDKGIVAEICSLGSKMPYPELLASGVAARPVSAAGLRGARKDRKATPQKVMQVCLQLIALPPQHCLPAMNRLKEPPSACRKGGAGLSWVLTECW